MSFIDKEVTSDKSDLSDYRYIYVYLPSGIRQDIKPTIFISIMHLTRATCPSSRQPQYDQPNSKATGLKHKL
jgi:hypothetical protein